MGTKQVKVDFLIVADDQVSATVTIKVGGVVKWSGDLADTSDMVPDYNTPPVPTVSAEFDLEVADGPTSQMTVPEDFTFTVTRGTAILKLISANYSVQGVEIQPPTDPATYNLVPGSATNFVIVAVTAQPTWNGQALTDRYNYIAGGSVMPFYTGEVLEFPVAMPMYQYTP
jgi:hypothetical protein